MKSIFSNFKKAIKESAAKQRPASKPAKTSNSQSKGPLYLRPISLKDSYTHRELWGIASNVQMTRERIGMTQKQLAEGLGYKSASFISRLELWEMENITHEQVVKLAKCLNVPIEKLLNTDTIEKNK